MKSLIAIVGATFIATAAWAHAGHGELVKMMNDYETVRAALAADDVPGAVSAGREAVLAERDRRENRQFQEEVPYFHLPARRALILSRAG